MPFCPDCGAKVTGAFCANCGAAIGASGPSPGPVSGVALEDHAAAALCYLFGFITGLLFLVWAPYNKSKNVRFHAYQSILLTAVWFLIQFAIAVMFPLGAGVTIGQLVSWAGLALWLFLMWKTYHKEKIVLPGIGPIAERQV